mgnify:CR=1 FL=1
MSGTIAVKQMGRGWNDALRVGIAIGIGIGIEYRSG